MATDIDYENRAEARLLMRRMVQITWEAARSLDTMTSWRDERMRLDGMMSAILWTNAFGDQTDPAYREADKFIRRLDRLAQARVEYLMEKQREMTRRIIEGN